VPETQIADVASASSNSTNAFVEPTDSPVDVVSSSPPAQAHAKPAESRLVLASSNSANYKFTDSYTEFKTYR